MAYWPRIGLLVILLGVAAIAPAASLAGLFSDELDADRYDCSVVLHPAAALAEGSAVTLTLEAGQHNDALRLTLTRQHLDIIAVVNGHATHPAPVPARVTPGVDYPLTILRRGGWLGVLHEQAVLFRGALPRAAGAQGGVVAGDGWTVDTPRVQHLEPVVFADNFMRTSDDDHGNWSIQRGSWALQSAWDLDPKGNANRFANVAFSQNPFAWVGHAAAGESALCTTGKAYWEDYTFTAALQPGAEGAAGVMVNMPDARNGYLVRWSPANDRGVLGDRLSLLKVHDGKTTAIAEDRGGYLPGQWYKLAVASTPQGLQVLVDGRLRLDVNDLAPWRGGVALYAEGVNGAVFNNITVYGHSLKTDLIEESQQTKINERFQEDHNGMEEWAARNDWHAFPGVPGQMCYRCDVYGDHWMALQVRPFGSKRGELEMTLNGDGQDAKIGYRALLKLEGGKLNYALYRNGVLLRTKSGPPLTPRTDYSLRFWHVGGKVWLEQDGERVLTATGRTAAPRVAAGLSRGRVLRAGAQCAGAGAQYAGLYLR